MPQPAGGGVPVDVGVEGIKLTGAGYLPPDHVGAAVAALDLGREWIGKGNREALTMPVRAVELPMSFRLP
ncbi:MAG: hypothetical protein ACRDOH_28565 [Streptosporangiaceae bacterium]